MLAGAALIDLKNKAKEDGNITVPEQNLINNQEQVLYTSIGMVAKDIVKLADVLGLGTAAATGWRGYNNLLIFIDSLNGTPLDPRPKVDIVLGIAIIADLNAVISQAINGIGDTALGKKIPPWAKVAGEVMGFSSDFWTIIANALTDSAGSGKAYIYLDSGEQLGFPDIAQTLINADYPALMNAVEQRIENIVDAMLDYIPEGIGNYWSVDSDVQQIVFIGDKTGEAISDHFSGSAVGDIAHTLADNDNLFGHGGDDILNGGKGNDYFDGGDDNDTLIDEEGFDHYTFSGNFGHDKIYDQDGRGTIQINGVTLAGGKRINDDEWKSADGIYTLSVVADSDGVVNFHNLIITKNTDINNSITIKSWENGELGISLTEFGQKQTATDGQYAFGNDGNNVIFNERYVASFGGNDLISSTDVC